MLELGDEHRRHAVDRRAALLLNRAEGRLGVERLGRNDDRATVSERTEVAHHTAEAVIERYRHQDAIVLGITERLADEEAVVEDVVVRKSCAFRRTGRARGVL